MKEKYSKVVIQKLMNHSDYGVIEINGQGRIPSAWCAKTFRFGSEKYLVFLYDEQVRYINEYRSIILSNTAANNVPVEVVTVIIVNNEDNDWQHIVNNQYENIAVVNPLNNDIIFNNVSSEDISRDIQNVVKRIEVENKSKKARIKVKDSKITLFIIAVNVLMYIITAALTVGSYGGSIFDSNIEVLYILGAKFNPAIVEGEYYRLVTCMFLHGGLLHLVMNMYALNAIGPLVEKMYGKLKYVIIYFAAGISSSLLSFFFSDSLSVGASGAIFGLLGAVLVFGLMVRNSIGKQFVNNILSVIIINVVIGLTLPNIDNFGHVGGLIGGLIISMLLMPKKQSN